MMNCSLCKRDSIVIREELDGTKMCIDCSNIESIVLNGCDIWGYNNVETKEEKIKKIRKKYPMYNAVEKYNFFIKRNRSLKIKKLNAQN